MKAWTLLFAVTLLAGCGTTGKSIQTELVIRDNSNCTINLYPMLETSSGDNATTSANKTDTLLKDLIKLPDQISAATNALEGAISGAAASGILAEVVDAVEPVDPGELLEEVPLKLYESGDKIWSWTGKKCEEYGGPIVVNIPECGSFTVEDPCGLYTPSGNPNDFSSWVWFPGLASKQKVTHPLGYASVFSKPGCVKPVTATITRTK